MCRLGSGFQSPTLVCLVVLTCQLEEGSPPSPQTAVAALLRAEAARMVGRVFPKDRDLERLPLGSGSGEHCVSYAEASWMAWVKGSCGVPHPVLQCWPGRWAGGCSRWVECQPANAPQAPPLRLSGSRGGGSQAEQRTQRTVRGIPAVWAGVNQKMACQGPILRKASSVS